MSYIAQCWMRFTGMFTPQRVARPRHQRHPVRLEPLEVRTLLAGESPNLAIVTSMDVAFSAEPPSPPNWPPVVTPVQFLIGENSVNKAFIGYVVATDVDSGPSKTFSITSGNTGNAFAINATTGVLTVKNSAALDFETRSQIDLTVRVDDHGMPAQFGTATVTVFLRDENDAPVVPNTGFLIGENSVNNAFIGTVSSSDQDAGQTKTYSLVAGNTDDAFAINPATGVLTVNNSAALDFEARTHFNLIARVADNGDPAQAGFGVVTVFLRDENDAPVVSPTQFLIGENSVDNAFIGVVSSTDEDAAQPVPLGDLSIARQTSNVTLSGALSPTGVVADAGTVLTSEILRDSGNMLAPVTTTTLLTDVRSSSGTTSLCMTGETITFAPRKGGRSIALVPFSVTATTTVQDFLNYLNNTLGIQTQADDPTIPNDAGTGGSPGVTLTAGGAIQIVGNAGKVNDINTSIGDILANGTSVPIMFIKTQEAVGEGTGANLVLFDSLGRPIQVRFTAGLEIRNVDKTTYRWFIESADVAGTDLAIATGTFSFGSLGTITQGEYATVSFDRSHTGAISPMQVTFDFSRISGITSNSAGGRLNLSSQDGSQPGTPPIFESQNVGQTRTYSLVAGNTEDAFAIDPTTGVLTVKNSAALDFETRQRFDLTVRVADNGNPAQAGFGSITVFLRDETGARPTVSPSVDHPVLPTINNATNNLLTRLRKRVA